MPSWGRHVKVAENVLRSTLYDGYYKEKDTVSMWDGVVKDGECEETMRDITLNMQAVCEKVKHKHLKQNAKRNVDTWSIAGNGVMIETSMILTSHSYAMLYSALHKIGAWLSPEELLQVAVYGYNQLSKMFSAAKKNGKTAGRRSVLQTTKNVAYGWRQIVFLVSTMDKDHAQLIFKKIVSKEQAAADAFFRRH